MISGILLGSMTWKSPLLKPPFNSAVAAEKHKTPIGRITGGRNFTVTAWENVLFSPSGQKCEEFVAILALFSSVDNSGNGPEFFRMH